MMNQEHIQQEVVDLANAWAVAEARGNTTFLEKTLADDFIGVGPLGFMLNRQQWLARHQSGDLTYESFTLDEIQERIYNDAAILTGRQAQNGAYRGNSIMAQFRVTLVFVRQQEQWRLASLQLSTIGQPPDFTRA